MGDEKVESKEAGAAAPKGGGLIGKLMGIVLPALVAGAASFGGTRVAGAQHAPPAADAGEAAKPPGPTLALEPFVFTVADSNKKAHPMKVALAVEFDSAAKEESLKSLVPRVRDATLSYQRTVTSEQAQDAASTEKARSELLAAIKASGAPGAQRVLVTDLVVQ